MSIDHERTIRQALLAGLGFCALLVLATPAQAGDAFENGFKDELGRIAAREAVHAGKHILVSVLDPGAHHRHESHGRVHPRHEHHGHHRHPRHGPPGHVKHHKHKKHKHHKHAHRRHHDHWAHHRPYPEYVRVRYEPHHRGERCDWGY